MRIRIQIKIKFSRYVSNYLFIFRLIGCKTDELIKDALEDYETSGPNIIQAITEINPDAVIPNVVAKTIHSIKGNDGFGVFFLWSFLEFPGGSWSFLEIPGISCSFMEFHGVSWNSFLYSRKFKNPSSHKINPFCQKFYHFFLPRF